MDTKLILEDLNLETAERRLCVAALELAGNIVGAAQQLGITRHALRRRMIKLRIDRPHASDQQGAAGTGWRLEGLPAGDRGLEAPLDSP